MDARPLFDQHADLAQLVFVQTVSRAVALAHGHPALAPSARSGPATAALLLSNCAHWRQAMIGILGRHAALPIRPELLQGLVQLVGEFHQLADRRHRATRAL